MTVGRNDPCPCGSGLKYKKCCLAREQAARPAAFFRDEDRTRVLRRLLAFGEGEDLATDRELADILFWGGRLDELDDDRQQELRRSEQCHIGFQSFFLFDLDADGGKSPCDLFVERHRSRLGDGEREFLRRIGASQLRPYEVTEVRRDEGLRLRDLWEEGPELWVREKLATHQIVRWDIVALRLVESAPEDRGIEGGLYVYPRETKDALLTTLREASAAFATVRPEASAPAFLKRHAMLFHHFWLDAVALRPPPTIVTTEGDALEFGTGIFTVIDEPELRRALAEHPGFTDAEADGGYTWREPGGRVLGSLRLAAPDLVVEVHSRARMKRLRELLARHAGPAVRFRSARYDDPWDAVERLGGPAPDGAPAGALPPEEQATLVRAAKDDHYLRWLDQPVPALGGRTPRQASRTTAGRAKLEELLKLYEIGEARAPAPGGAPYDFGWLRRELNMDRTS